MRASFYQTLEFGAELRRLRLSGVGKAQDFEYARGMLQVAAACALTACSP